MTKIKQTVKTATYNDYLVTLRLIFRTIMKSAGLEENPFLSIDKLAITDHKGHSSLTDGMIQKITETVNSENFRGLTSKASKRIEVPAQEMRTLIQLGLSTGMRLKDAVLLAYENIDWKQGVIKISTCKGIRHNKRVFIPIMPALKVVLDENGTGYVMPTLARNYLSVGGYTSVDEIQHLFAQAGLTVNDRDSTVKGIRRTNSYGFHSFRHVFVSKCAAMGIPQAIVESIVGTNAEVLKKYYTHISTENIREAMKMLN
jgi:integrase